MDQNPTTAWITEWNPDRGQSYVTMNLPEVTKVYGILLQNGHGKSIDLMKEYARAKEVHLEANGQAIYYQCIDFHELYEWDVDIQYTDLILFQEPVMTDEVTFWIDSIYDGNQYKELCISELLLLE